MNNTPRTIRELYFFVEGEFETLKSEIKNLRKITFWIASVTGSIITGIIIGILKLSGWIK